jgi:hypothetical protein
MKKLSIITVAILLGLGGVAMAGSGDCGIYCTNSTGPNPFMPEVSTSSAAADAAYAHAREQNAGSAYAQAPVQHHIVHHHVKK